MRNGNGNAVFKDLRILVAGVGRVNIWIYYSLPLSLLVGIVTTVWFTWGSSRDLYRLLKSLKEAQNTTDNEDGQVKEDEKVN